MGKDTIIQRMNLLGKNRTPFVFIFDFALEEPLVLEMEEIDTSRLQFNFNGFRKESAPPPLPSTLEFSKFPVDFPTYDAVFQQIYAELQQGNSYLCNLTFETPIQTNYGAEAIYHAAHAPYKLWWDQRFLVFSPEIFVRISPEGSICSFPMKGTLDADLEGAEQTLKQDPKEFAEHCTIVDLIRNDLSRVSQEVRVEEFAYTDVIKTNQKNLLQLSSRITGRLSSDFHEHLGNILWTMLPAGSVSGAPKIKTTEIIQTLELHRRGYYTGIMGYYDGYQLDSAVMIRFIDLSSRPWKYKSGGGITINSQSPKEYQEMIDKVYVPIF